MQLLIDDLLNFQKELVELRDRKQSTTSSIGIELAEFKTKETTN